MSCRFAARLARGVVGLVLPLLGLTLGSGGAALAQQTGVVSCTVSFVLAQFRPEAIGNFRYRVEYDPQTLTLVGHGSDVACRGKVADLTGGSVPSEFADDDAGSLLASFSSTVGVPTFTPLATCDLFSPGEPLVEDFTTTVLEAAKPDGSPIVTPPPVLVSEVTCAGPATTTTTTMPTDPGCADPAFPHGDPNASDCLFILRAAVGSESCSPACVCSPSGSSVATATDALLCLKSATGLDVSLICPCS